MPVVQTGSRGVWRRVELTGLKQTGLADWPGVQFTIQDKINSDILMPILPTTFFPFSWQFNMNIVKKVRQKLASIGIIVMKVKKVNNYNWNYNKKVKV